MVYSLKSLVVTDIWVTLTGSFPVALPGHWRPLMAVPAPCCTVQWEGTRGQLTEEPWAGRARGSWRLCEEVTYR